MWGKSKKKLALATVHVQTTSAEISKRQEEVTRSYANALIAREETRQIQAKIEEEKSEREIVHADTGRLNKELERASQEVADLQAQIAKSREMAAAAKVAKEAVHQELAKQEEVVSEEHTAAEASAEVAREYAAALQCEQEEDGRRWQAVREAHEQLRNQADTGARKREKARADRDGAKRSHEASQEGLREAMQAHGQLKKDVEQTEGLLTSNRQKRVDLEGELATLRDRVSRATAEHATLDECRKTREEELAGLTCDLEGRQAHLQANLNAHAARFDLAKAERERVRVEHDSVKAAMGTIIPTYFELQRDNMARRRELEHARRDNEILNWEHHKVNRDLEMLAKSYDVGFLPPAAFAVPGATANPSLMQ